MKISVDYKKYYESKIKYLLKEKNLLYIQKRIAYRLLFQPIIRNKPNNTFIFNELKYKYFYNSYNTTFINERAIEIPIFKRMLDSQKKNNVLEIGNTLSHYFPLEWTVIDKYDTCSGIIQVDCEDFTSEKKFDLILSISTLEHVGHDEIPQDLEKPIRVIHHIRNNLLSHMGKFIFSIPAGWNRNLEQMLHNGAVPNITHWHAFQRVSSLNDWVQLKDPKTIFSMNYNGMYATGLHIIEIAK